MDKKAAIYLIVGFMLGVSQWLADRAYDFGGGRVVGMVDTLISSLPFVNSVWFLTGVYWIARLMPVIVVIVLICVLSFQGKGKRKQHKRIDDENIGDTKLKDSDSNLGDLIQVIKRLNLMLPRLNHNILKLTEKLEQQNGKPKKTK